MQKMTKKYISWMLSALMCFNNSFTVIQAEEKTHPEEPGSQEIVEEEQVEEITEVMQEEETEDEKDPAAEVISEDEENLEVAEQDSTEIQVDEIQQEEQPEEESTEIVESAEDEAVQEESELTEDEKTEEVIFEEETKSSIFSTPVSDFTYTTSNDEVTITKYKGSDIEVDIPSEIDGYPVTSIGSEAFKNCSKLTSITIPEGVTSIGDSVFYNCSGLTGISIPKGVICIGDLAFYSCTGLTSISIPEGVTSIGDVVFFNCSKLTSITIPEGVTSIGDYAFSSCGELTSITIPEGVTSIGNNAFSYCYSLISITIPEGVTSIGNYAFYGCSSLTSIMIPEMVTSIGDATFNGCSSLTSIMIPEGLTSIGDYAFAGCNSLTDITIPERVTSIGDYAFSGCGELTSITIPEGVTSIGNNAFSYCYSLISITIPEGVTGIGDYAFYYCNNLSSIVIPEGVTSIGNYAFSYCSKLKKVYYSGNQDKYSQITIGAENNYLKSATNYYNSCFFEEYAYLNSNDGTVEIIGYIGASTIIEIPKTIDGKTVTSISNSAFSGCSSLTSVTIPAGITSVGDYAFSYCSSLTSITIPEGITSIGDYAFSYCSSLTSITIPEGVTSIGEWTFYNCSSLTSITIPEGVTSIGNYAFYGCSKLTSITIPEGVTSIGTQVFYNCNSLINITISDSVTSIGTAAFAECSSLTDITIPDNVISIGDGAFESCISLTNITIPDYVTSIEGFAFYGCSSLISITIPKSITSIYDSAFDDCSALKHVYYQGSEKQFSQISIEDYNTDFTNAAIHYNCVLGDEFYYTILSNGTIEIAGYNGNAVTVTVPSIINGKEVTSIGTNAFYSDSSLTSITIPEGVTSIGDFAFADCSVLSDITLTSSVKTIGIGAFLNCPHNMTIHYYGTEADWNSIRVKSSNESFTDSDIIFEQLITSLKLEKKSYSLLYGESIKIAVTAKPDGVSVEGLQWTSSNPEVASVSSDGTVTTVSDGETTITVKAPAGNASASCKVTVHSIKAKGISITSTLDSVTAGNKLPLSVIFDPANTSNKNVKWSSSDETIAVVTGTSTNAVVTGLKGGIVTITATSEDGGFTDSVEITVLQAVTGITLDKTEIRLAVNSSQHLTASVLPEDASNKNVTWSSDNVSVATVDEEGNVTALSEGTATITATAEDGGFTAECKVNAFIVYAEGITIDESASVSDIEFGKTGTIQITFEPANTSNKKLIWTSSDESIAQVDENGVITAVGEGAVTITAESEDGGFTASKEINVFCVHIESISFEEETVEVIAGKAISTSIVFNPENASNKKVNYTSDHPEIATVNGEGTVNAFSEGTAVITAVSEDGNKTASVMVTVLPADLYVKDVDAEYSYAGTAIKPVPAVYDSGVLLTAGKDYTVAYKNNTNAYTYEGDRSSFIPVKGDKTPYILITGKGNYSGKTYVPFSITQIDLNDPDQVYVEESITLKANNKVQRPVPVITFNGKVLSSKEYTLTYLDSENNPLDKKTGPKAAGTYTIVVTGNGKNFIGEKEIPLTIAEETVRAKTVALSRAITLTAANAVYDDTAKETASVTSKADYVLTEGKDYTVSYANNIKAGTANVTATGKGIYTGTVKKTFKITPRIYLEHTDEFNIEVSDAVYSKGGSIPEVHVFWKDNELKAGTDYTLKYANNKKVTDEFVSKWPTVTITFKGNFKGAVTKDFFIDPKPLDQVTITSKDKVYSAKANAWKSAPVLNDTDGKTLKAGTDYEKTITYTTVDGKELPAVVDPGTVVMVTVTGKGNYRDSVGSTTYRILEAGKDISKATFKIVNQEYTGSPVELTEADITATINKTTELVLGTDYVIDSYTNNLKKGTAKVTFRGINGYGGTKTVSFKIGQRSISDYWQGVKNFFARMS